MDPAEIDWKLQDDCRTVLRAAAEIFGERRFARGRLAAQGDRRPTMDICAVDPTPDEISELDRLAANAGLALVVHCVRYSYNDLLAFYETVSGAELSGDAWVKLGVDDMANAIRFTLRRPDQQAMAYIRERLPADAIHFEIEPRAGHASAL